MRVGATFLRTQSWLQTGDAVKEVADGRREPCPRVRCGVCHASRLGGVGVKLMVGVGDPHSLHKVLVDFGELTIQSLYPFLCSSMADGIHRGTFRATPIFNHFQTNDGSMLSCSRVGIPSNPSAVNAVYNQSTWAVLKFSGVYAEACLVNTSDDHSIIVSDDLVHPACHKKPPAKQKSPMMRYLLICSLQAFILSTGRQFKCQLEVESLRSMTPNRVFTSNHGKTCRSLGVSNMASGSSVEVIRKST